MARVPLTPAPPEDRYARQRLIPGWDQAALATTTAVVVGVGALGNEVAKNLALAGVGRLILCDPDTVAETNLSRTVLFGPSDVGRPKVTVAAERLHELAPGIRVETRRADLAAGVGLGELADAGVVLGCLDSRRARLRLLGRAALVDAALVDGGTYAWGGEIRVRRAAADSCYGCSLSRGQRAESDVPRGCADTGSAGAAPASVLATSLVAAWMTLSASRLLMARNGSATPPPYRLLRVDGLSGTTAPVSVFRDPECPYHHPLDGEIRSLPLGAEGTVAELLALLPDGDDPWVWEGFAVSGPCRGCGLSYDPPTSGHGVAVCSRCGTANRVRRSDRARDAPLTARLRELGVARGEILPARTARGDFRWYRMAT